ncbi:MAG: M23 family metallopeptidase [Gemmatimonadales bacterium]
MSRASRIIRLTAAIGLLAGCAAIERLPDQLFDGRSPRERYVARLEAVGLDHTAAGRDWIEASDRSLRAAPAVSLPHEERGRLQPTAPGALAYRFSVERGQRVSFEVRFVDDSTIVTFLEAWRVDPQATDGVVVVATADSGDRRLEFAPRETGDYVVLAVPELLRGGRYAATLRVAPTLAFPVERGRASDVGSRFGAPRDGGARRHHGIDIFARRGTPAVAAATAVVTRVETTRIGGNVVWLRDDAGHSIYYAHLDRSTVARGDRVAPGDTVGFVGNTGNARTTPPHLHFGIYRRGEGPLDPWWFVAPVRTRAAPLRADLALLGDTVRLRAPTALSAAPNGATLPAETPLLIVAVAGDGYRVRVPDGREGFVAAAALEPAAEPLARTTFRAAEALRARPVATYRPEDVIAEVRPGTDGAVLGRFDDHLLVRLPSGAAGWIAEGR